MAIVKGTAANNSLLGTSDDDEIFGLGGNDILTGLAGNDVLNGGFGNDTMFGGLGNDRYVVDSVLDIVDETGGSGLDAIEAYVSYGLSDNVENLFLRGSNSIDGVGNTLDNLIEGNNQANTIDGGSGDDRLSGHDGDDLLIGGLGNDTSRAVAALTPCEEGRATTFTMSTT